MGKNTPYKVKVTGVPEVTRQFKSLGFKSGDLSGVFARIGGEVASDAKSMAPRRTGRLAGDIRAGTAKTRATIAVGRSSVPYAGPINYGWRRRGIEPSLFMNHAADSKTDSAADQITREMKRLINSAGF